MNQYQDALQNSDGLKMFYLSKHLDQNVWIALYNSGEKGQKTKQKELTTRLEKEGSKIFWQLQEAYDTQDAGMAYDVLSDLHSRELIGELYEPAVIEWLDEVSPAEAA